MTAFLRVFIKAFGAPTARSGRPRPQKSLAVEPLEPRIALSAAGLVDVGTQPDGNLSGKIVYTHGGHGITGDFPGAGDWSFQRPLLLNMIEDLGNQDQMTFFADYLFRAGATVVPLRPVGHQVNEVVLDNDDAEVTFTGAWSNSSAPIYFGDLGDVPYRFASTSATETAAAEYRPDIPEEGFYPVYAWTRYGSDRAADQLYRVNHSGGSTEVTVNHRRVGNGTVYLGTYHFEAGTGGSVEISNRSSETGRVVIADMIRFGNGVGDVIQSGTTSGRDREDEAGLYWVEWHVEHSQGISSSEYRSTSDDRDATVSLSPRYSEYMNREADGSLWDRVFVSFHSNAGGGRGVVGLHNTNQGGNTPNQFLLASTLGQEVNDDLVAQNGQFEHNWSDRGNNVTYQASFNYGEINNSVINNEFDATIVETAFHDSQFDAELMRDANVRDAIARATYQGLAKYFNSVDGGATSLTMLPAQVDGLRAESTGSGSVDVSWETPTANSYLGNPATGYMIYGSTNGYGFDGGTFVAGGSSTTHTFTGLDPAEGAYYFKVAPVNSGGEGAASEVVAAIPGNTPADVLIVNGFDRLGRTQNPVQNGAERVRPRQSNSMDYAVQVAAAIENVAPTLAVDSASNESILAGDLNLTDYDAVIWILGEESSADDTFNDAEQTLTADYLAAGGKLFVSGAEIGWDLDQLDNGRTFYENQLRANYVADDANTYSVSGAVGSIFEGLSFSFDDGSQFYDVDYPDVINPLGGAVTALNYATGGGAAIQFDGGPGGPQVVHFGFPYETITDAQTRNQVLGNVLEFFGFDVTLPEVEYILDNDNGPPQYVETGSWTTSSATGFNGGTYRFGVTGGAHTAAWNFNVPADGQGEVFVYYVAGSNRATSVVYEIDAADGVESTSIDQTQNGATWVSLGTFEFAAGASSVTLDAQASSGGSVVIADAVRVVFSTAPPVEPTADFNQDLRVDGFDFLSWQRGVGVGSTLAEGDSDDDGDVDGADLATWEATFGTVTPPAAQYAASPKAPPARGLESLASWQAPTISPRRSELRAVAADLAISNVGPTVVISAETTWAPTAPWPADDSPGKAPPTAEEQSQGWDSVVAAADHWFAALGRTRPSR